MIIYTKIIFYKQKYFYVGKYNLINCLNFQTYTKIILYTLKLKLDRKNILKHTNNFIKAKVI